MSGPDDASDTEGAAERLCSALGYSFDDRQWLTNALTHRSFRNEHPELAPADNERLEFLGDAVADLVVAAMLFDQFPEADEGELTRRRADLVSEKGLSEAAEALGVGAAMRLGRGEEKSGGRHKPRLLSSVLEACIGAIYCDGGPVSAFSTAARVFEPRVAASALGRRDAKSRAQEWAQAHLGATPRYRVVDTDGPDHAREFTVALEVDDDEVARGTGRSKVVAEQAAAEAALDRWLAAESADAPGDD